MSKPFKKIFCLLSVITIISCGTKKVNTTANKRYYKSIETFSGELDNSSYQNLKNNIEKELNSSIPEGKSILINFYQEAPNCISSGYSENDFSIMTDKVIKFSSEISSSNNAVDFFVYAENSSRKENYRERENFRMDSDYFYNNIFTHRENCAGFLILKPNGEFLKYFGEDYFSKVEEFLEKE